MSYTVSPQLLIQQIAGQLVQLNQILGELVAASGTTLTVPPVAAMASADSRDLVQGALPAVLVYVEGTIDAEERLYYVQDLSIPLVLEVVYQAVDWPAAQELGEIYARSCLKLLERSYHRHEYDSLGVWDLVTESSGVLPTGQPLEYAGLARATAQMRSARAL